MPSPNLQSMLDISTGHLRKQDIEALERYTGNLEADGNLKLNASPQQYGWIVSTGVFYHGGSKDEDVHVIEQLKQEGFSDEFIALLKHARDNAAAIIRFDRDASCEPGFPVFEYGTDERVDVDEDHAAAPSL